MRKNIIYCVIGLLVCSCVSLFAENSNVQKEISPPSTSTSKQEQGKDKIITPKDGTYVIGTWTQGYWAVSDFTTPEDLNTYNHVSCGMITYLDTLSTGTATDQRWSRSAARPWDKLEELSKMKAKYPNPIYGYSIGGADTAGTVHPEMVTASFDTNTPWNAFDLDAEGVANTREFLSVYNDVAKAKVKPQLTTYTFEVTDGASAGFASVAERIQYLEKIDNPPDRYILMCYWGTQWNKGSEDLSGKLYKKIPDIISDICGIHGINTKKVFLALCTKPYEGQTQDPQFKDFCEWIKEHKLGGLYIWLTAGFPLTQATADILNTELGLTPPLVNR